MKKGYQTTEFWLSLLATLLGALLASGLLVEGSGLAQVIGFALTALSALGYTAGRSFLKVSENKRQATEAWSRAVVSPRRGRPPKALPLEPKGPPPPPVA